MFETAKHRPAIRAVFLRNTKGVGASFLNVENTDLFL